MHVNFYGIKRDLNLILDDYAHSCEDSAVAIIEQVTNDQKMIRWLAVKLRFATIRIAGVDVHLCTPQSTDADAPRAASGRTGQGLWECVGVRKRAAFPVPPEGYS